MIVGVVLGKGDAFRWAEADGEASVKSAQRGLEA